MRKKNTKKQCLHTTRACLHTVHEKIVSYRSVLLSLQVGKHSLSKKGILDLNIYDYNVLFGTDLSRVMNKADRMIYGESQMTHAMVLTGVHLDVSMPMGSWDGKGRGRKFLLLILTLYFVVYEYEYFFFHLIVPWKISREEFTPVFLLSS